MRPQRLLLGALLVPAFALIGLIALVQQPLVGVIVGAIGGVIAGLLLVATYSRGDSQYLRVVELRPNAIVLQCRRNETTGWAEFDRLVLDAAVHGIGGTFTLSFEFGELTLWGGAAEPVPLLTIPYSQVADIAVGENYWRRSFFSQASVSYARLELSLLVDGELRRVRFGVDEAGRSANETRLAFLALELRDALEGVVHISAEQRPHTRLISGMTAWTARQLGVILLVVAGVLALALISIAIVIGGEIAVYLYALAGLLITVAGAVLLYSVAVGRNELDEGYTTLHGSHLEVEQRHPATGSVIRSAGSPALTNDQLRAALTAG